MSYMTVLICQYDVLMIFKVVCTSIMHITHDMH